MSAEDIVGRRPIERIRQAFEVLVVAVRAARLPGARSCPLSSLPVQRESSGEAKLVQLLLLLLEGNGCDRFPAGPAALRSAPKMGRPFSNVAWRNPGPLLR